MTMEPWIPSRPTTLLTAHCKSSTAMGDEEAPWVVPLPVAVEGAPGTARAAAAPAGLTAAAALAAAGLPA